MSNTALAAKMTPSLTIDLARPWHTHPRETAGLGLLGLAAYAAERRKKELGIRKVLGATVQGLFVLLSKDFIKLVIVAFVIASPIAWIIMHNWLGDFAYRIDISWWIFIIAGLLAVSVALATISFQAIKAALANPVKSLRTE